MRITLSDRVQQIKPSPTLAVNARATALKAEGKDVIDLGVGEPDFDTPDPIKEAAIGAINRGFTKYTAVDGIPSLKQAIIQKFQKDNNLSYEPKQILVSVGGKQSFFNLAQALLNPGDEVIIPAPYWVSYPDMVILAGAKPIIITTIIEQNFKITPEQLSKAITPRTKLFVINSPANPTGIHYSPQELEALAKVLVDYPQILIATDDMYEHILWRHEPFKNILMVCPQLYDRTIVLNGVSKAYAMTGWRIGYAGGPAELINAMKNIQSQSTSNPTSISQVAAEAALRGDQSSIQQMNRAFKERHDKVYAGLNAISGIKCLPADGTFYLFPNIEKAIKSLGLKDDLDFAEKLLIEKGVALVPGSAFGAPNCIRLSFATSMELLEKSLQRIKQFVNKEGN